MPIATYGASRWCAARWDDPPGLTNSVLMMARPHTLGSGRLRPNSVHLGRGRTAAAVADLPAIRVAAEMASLGQALMPARKEVLLEGHEVRALLGTCREVVTVEPDPGVASTCAAVRNKGALFDGVEGMQPTFEAGKKRLLHDSVSALHFS